jgi:hypothetical protein
MFLGKLHLPLADPSQAREDSRFCFGEKSAFIRRMPMSQRKICDGSFQPGQKLMQKKRLSLPVPLREKAGDSRFCCFD